MKIKEVLLENEELKERIKVLEQKLEIKEKMLEGVKLNNSKITLERNQLNDELSSIKNSSLWEFADKYCNDKELEEAGHMLAKDLLKIK